MPIPKLPLQLAGLLPTYHRLWWRRTLRRRSVVTEWNERHQAIFVHIPKTAGTSVLAALGAASVFDTHAPARTYRDCYPALFDRAYTFAFIRNPWDRFASAFHFMRDGTEWPMQQDWAKAHIGEMGFRDFTLKLRSPVFRAQVMAERFFWPQRFWLTDARGRIMVDELFRFEQLDDAISSLCARLGMPRQPATPHLRKVEKPDFRTLYDEDMTALVGRLYARDIAAFGLSLRGERRVKSRLASSAFWAIAGNGTQFTVVFLLLVYLARILTPRDFGLMATVSIGLDLGTRVARWGQSSCSSRSATATTPRATSRCDSRWRWAWSSVACFWPSRGRWARPIRRPASPG